MSTAQIETEISKNKTLQALFVPNAAILDVAPPPRNPETGEIHNATLLFLDIDGVLNGHFTQVVYGTLPHPDPNAIVKGYVTDADSSDHVAAKLINKVCEATGALIVLSSSWRVGMKMDEIPTVLESLGIDPSLVIGRTDTIYDPDRPNTTRGNQIERFLQNIITEEGRAFMYKYDMLGADVKFGEKVKVDAYAIIDDDADFLENQLPNFVQTTFMDGLTCSHAIALGKILSNDETFYLSRLGGFNIKSPSDSSLWM